MTSNGPRRLDRGLALGLAAAFVVMVAAYVLVGMAYGDSASGSLVFILALSPIAVISLIIGARLTRRGGGRDRPD